MPLASLSPHALWHARWRERGFAALKIYNLVKNYLCESPSQALATSILNRSAAPSRKVSSIKFFDFFSFLDPALVLEVPDMVCLIPEVWDFYLVSGARFFLP